MKKFKNFKEYKKEFKKINSGSWNDASYYYDEECINCGYKSKWLNDLDNYSFNEFLEFDDYDYYRWKETNKGCICELCYRRKLCY